MSNACSQQQKFKILQKDMPLEKLYAGQEATVKTGHGTTDWFQIGKGVRQAVYCHPAYLTYRQSTS